MAKRRLCACFSHNELELIHLSMGVGRGGVAGTVRNGVLGLNLGCGLVGEGVVFEHAVFVHYTLV